jgi:hypothetical protein
MKKIFLVVVSFSLLGTAWASITGNVMPKPKTFQAPQTSQSSASAKSKTGKAKAVKQSVTFNGKKFYLEYSNGNGQEWLNEYLPAGQKFETYTEMIAVRSYDTLQATPAEIAQAIADNYARDYPGVKYLLAANDKTGDGLVSFIMIGGNVLEHNLFRTTLRGSTPVAIQHVYRKYLPKGQPRSKEDMSAFAKDTSSRRAGWINALDAMPVPETVRTVKQ